MASDDEDFTLSVKILEHLEYRTFTFSRDITAFEARRQIGEETETNWQQHGLFLQANGVSEPGCWLKDEYEIELLLPDQKTKVLEYKPRYRYISLYLDPSKQTKRVLIDDTFSVGELMPIFQDDISPKNIVDLVHWVDPCDTSNFWSEDNLEILSPSNSFREQGFIGEISVGVCQGRKENTVFAWVPYRAGYLSRKRSNRILKGIMSSRPTWIRKYYLLQRDRIFIFKDHYKVEEEGSIPLHTLTGVAISDQKDLPSETGFPFDLILSNKKITLAAATNEERSEWVNMLKEGINMFAREPKFYKTQAQEKPMPTGDADIINPSNNHPKRTPQPTGSISELSFSLIPLPEANDQKERDEIEQLLGDISDDDLDIDVGANNGENLQETVYDDVAMELLLWEEEISGNLDPELSFLLNTTEQKQENNESRSNENQNNENQNNENQKIQNNENQNNENQNNEIQKIQNQNNENQKIQNQSQNDENQKGQNNQNQIHMGEIRKNKDTNETLSKDTDIHDSTDIILGHQPSNRRRNRSGTRFESLDISQQGFDSISESLPTLSLVPQNEENLNPRTSVRYRLSQNPAIFQKYKEFTSGRRSVSLKPSLQQKAQLIKFFNSQVPDQKLDERSVTDTQLEKAFFQHLVKAFPVAKFFCDRQPSLPDILMGWVHWVITSNKKITFPPSYKAPTLLSSDFKSGELITYLAISLNETHMLSQLHGNDRERIVRALPLLRCPIEFSPDDILSGNPLHILYLLTTLFYLHFPKQKSVFEREVTIPLESLCNIYNYLFHCEGSADSSPFYFFNFISRMRSGYYIGALLQKTFFNSPPFTFDLHDPKKDILPQVISVCRDRGVYMRTTNLGELKDGIHFLNLILDITYFALSSRVTYEKYPQMETFIPKEKYDPSAEEKILAWINFQTQAEIKNLGSDLSDGMVLGQLIAKIFPESTVSPSAMRHLDTPERLSTIVQAIKSHFDLKIPLLLLENPLPKAWLMFLVLLFQYRPYFRQLNTVSSTISDEQRRERALRVWINSFHLPNRKSNGLEHLDQLIDFLPLFSCVFSEKQLRDCPTHDNKKIFNHLTQMFQTLGIPNNIQADEFFGSDPQKQYSLFHKIRLYDIFHFREKLLNPNFSDQDIIQWANNKIRMAKKTHFASSIEDPSLATGRFFIDLLYALDKTSINYNLVKESDDPKVTASLAKYVISATHTNLKVNVFLLWEDIVERNIPMLLAFLCSLVLKFNNTPFYILPTAFERNSHRKFSPPSLSESRKSASPSSPSSEKSVWVSSLRSQSPRPNLQIGHKDPQRASLGRTASQTVTKGESMYHSATSDSPKRKSTTNGLGWKGGTSILSKSDPRRLFTSKRESTQELTLNETAKTSSDRLVFVSFTDQKSTHVMEMSPTTGFHEIRTFIHEKFPSLSEYTLWVDHKTHKTELTEQTYGAGAFLNSSIRRVEIVSK